MSGNSKSNIAIYDWPTQLEVFRAMYNTNDIKVKYIDDEGEEVGIESQADLDYAYQIALNSTNNVLRLILRNSRNEIISRPNLIVDLKTINSIKTRKNSQLIQNNKTEASKVSIQNSNQGFTDNQIKWIENYMNEFKSNLMKQVDEKIQKSIDSITKTRQNENKDLISFDENNLEKKVEKLLNLISESRTARRALKTAYLEEELQSTEAFMSEFVKDHNVPDGSRCEPNLKFKKTWLIKNIGKLDWDCKKFQVRLVCVDGNINTVNGLEYVNVEDTKVNETSSISVEFIAPSQSGNYISEWVLCCNGFTFGPRIWCSINVNGNDILNQSNNQLNLSRISSIHSRTEYRQMINSDDLDDEFVVVPDCFDLTKKWRPEVPIKMNNNDADLTILNSESSSDSILSDISTSTRKETSEENKNVKELIENVELAKESVLNKISVDVNVNQNPHQFTNAFDMMKNAFSNLGSPSFVGGIDVNDENDIDANMNKLIRMGFANRNLNKKLLDKYENKLEVVIQKLVEKADNNWMENR